MSNNDSQNTITINAVNLYKEESYTDRQVGTIQRLTPVKQDGSKDPDREMLYFGQTQIMTQAGPMPISFPIQAKSIDEAVLGFGEAAKAGIEDTMKRIEEMRREQASSIVVPGQDSGPKIQV